MVGSARPFELKSLLVRDAWTYVTAVTPGLFGAKTFTFSENHITCAPGPDFGIEVSVDRISWSPGAVTSCAVPNAVTFAYPPAFWAAVWFRMLTIPTAYTFAHQPVLYPIPHPIPYP